MHGLGLINCLCCPIEESGGGWWPMGKKYFIESVIRLVTIVLVTYNSKEEKEETGEIEGQAQHYKLTELHMDKPPACLEFFQYKKKI